jgi:adenine phosphoribosyltransferase
MTAMPALASFVRAIPDFPQRGVLFRDLTPLWADGAAWARTLEALARPFDAAPPQVVLGVEARGFLIAAGLAARWSAGLMLARKPGKLPGSAAREEFTLEYGTASIESHRDLFAPETRVLVADDVLATGGTAVAALALVEALGLKPVGFAFVVEIAFLGGRAKLGSTLPVHAVLSYDAAGEATVSPPAPGPT